MGGMNANWLAQLAPDHAPPPVGWWPPAPGWWVLAGLVLIAAVASVVWLRRPSRRLRLSALRELRQIEAAGGADAELARDLELLLRRYAVARFGRTAVAQLSGQAWISFVVSHGGEGWSGMAGSELLRAAYGGSPATTHRPAWLDGARAFLRKARA
jgi:hypothetical protein